MRIYLSTLVFTEYTLIAAHHAILILTSYPREMLEMFNLSGSLSCDMIWCPQNELLASTAGYHCSCIRSIMVEMAAHSHVLVPHPSHGNHKWAANCLQLRGIPRALPLWLHRLSRRVQPQNSGRYLQRITVSSSRQAS